MVQDILVDVYFCSNVKVVFHFKREMPGVESGMTSTSFI